MPAGKADPIARKEGGGFPRWAHYLIWFMVFMVLTGVHVLILVPLAAADWQGGDEVLPADEPRVQFCDTMLEIMNQPLLAICGKNVVFDTSLVPVLLNSMLWGFCLTVLAKVTVKRCSRARRNSRSSDS